MAHFRRRYSPFANVNFCLAGTGVCNGDSGGGMFFERNGLYSLRGVVSLGVSQKDEPKTCNLQQYVVFTDAAKYLDWIRENSA